MGRQKVWDSLETPKCGEVLLKPERKRFTGRGGTLSVWSVGLLAGCLHARGLPIVFGPVIIKILWGATAGGLFLL